MTVGKMLFLALLLFYVLFGGEAGDRWTVEPFSGPLSGRTVTVTRQMWSEGALMEEAAEGPMRPEAIFALNCLREEMRSRWMRLPEKYTRETAWTAEYLPPGTAAERWLDENAWRFGFITAHEPGERGKCFRLRYVGLVHAAVMRALDMDLEAYLLYLRETGQARLMRNGQAAAWILCVPEREALTFTLPEGAAWEISGDGTGWVIAAILSGS